MNVVDPTLASPPINTPSHLGGNTSNKPLLILLHARGDARFCAAMQVCQSAIKLNFVSFQPNDPRSRLVRPAGIRGRSCPARAIFKSVADILVAISCAAGPFSKSITSSNY